MRLIVMSDPAILEKEQEVVNLLFREGMETFHLRKPGIPEAELLAYLSKINPLYYRRMVLHSHYRLIEKYNFKGIHLPEYFRKDASKEQILSITKSCKIKGLSISTSVHSNEELEAIVGYDYILLSPVFDSISKTGYKGNIDLKKTGDILSNKKRAAIALGGIEESNLDLLYSYGFSGVAVLGAIWKDYQPENQYIVTSKFRSINHKLKHAGAIGEHNGK